ncbi:MAG: aminotransferase class I/II-fold pyridoxal phosphate-dependent enzyme [Planctomycetia bacterium]|nr:aminotransferase class I/II-fold pyridoxal phosphate-dependent enzyme [Planctomycetia bacterium]
MLDSWLSDRSRTFNSSGIRKVFDLGAKLSDPINLSIGQPDFDMPELAHQGAIEAIQAGKSSYTPTQGIAPLLARIQSDVDAKYNDSDRKVFITSGTSGGLLLAALAFLNPGDEVILFDPYFVMYESLTKMVGAVPVCIDTYPDYNYDVQKVADAITPKTKMILFNSPANPTGHVASREEVESIAKLAKEKNIILISDEIYHSYSNGEFYSPAEFNSDVLVLDGFSKSHGMPGWRIGFAHGPSEMIQTMLKFQQYTFVCAPHVAQLAVLKAYDADLSDHFTAYRKKRDMLIEGLSDLYDLGNPTGAFYMFPKVPWGTGTTFVEKAITKYKMLIIPGNVFSRRDECFRLSYSASVEMIERGIDALRKLAKDPD